MHWIEIPNQLSPQISDKVLKLDINDDIMLAYEEFWLQLLNYAIDYAGPDDLAELLIDICTVHSQEEDQGQLSAYFANSLNRRVAGMLTYRVEGRAFDFFSLPDEDNQSYYKRELPFLLAHYQKLKQAAQYVKPLFKRLADENKYFAIKLSTGNDWFDMQVDEPEFGVLPAIDLAVLGGTEPPPKHPFAHLLPDGIESFNLVQELSDALIEYTPPHFSVICFEAKHVSTEAALWFSIECPQHPHDGTNQVNQRVREAAEKIATRIPSFNGSIFRLRLEEQPDGQWKTTWSVDDV